MDEKLAVEYIRLISTAETQEDFKHARDRAVALAFSMFDGITDVDTAAKARRAAKQFYHIVKDVDVGDLH